MIKKIKFVLGFLVIALGFFFCFCMVSVNAAEDVETTTETADLFLNHLKDLKWNEAEAIIGWLIAYIIANAGIIALFVIKFILGKLREYKNSDAHNKTLEKLDAEHKAEIEAKEKRYEEKLETLLQLVEENNKANQAKLEELTNDSTRAIAQDLAKVTDYLKEDN